MASRRQNKLLAAGAPAPGFRLAQLDGGEVWLDELNAEQPVLLAFFKITCPVCQMTMPFLERLHREGKLRVYGISQNDADDTREFNRRFGISFPVLLDSEDDGFPTSNEYGIGSVPTMFLVETDGTASRVLEGWNKLDMESLGTRAGMVLFRAGDNVPAWKAG